MYCKTLWQTLLKFSIEKCKTAFLLIGVLAQMYETLHLLALFCFLTLTSATVKLCETLIISTARIATHFFRLEHNTIAEWRTLKMTLNLPIQSGCWEGSVLSTLELCWLCIYDWQLQFECSSTFHKSWRLWLIIAVWRLAIPLLWHIACVNLGSLYTCIYFYCQQHWSGLKYHMCSFSFLFF